MIEATRRAQPRLASTEHELKATIRISIQGEPGSYSDLAAREYFGKPEIVNCKNFTDAFGMVGHGANYAVLPIENSIEGIVTQVCDLLLAGNLHIIGEHIIRVEHCLIANNDVRLEDIRTVYSHPQALAQSSKYLESLGVEIIPFSDTAGSVKMIKEKGLTDAAGVASSYAASVYGMQILRRNLETHDTNYTRFVVLAKESIHALGEHAKTSIGFLTNNIPGALYKALGCFADNDVNLIYLQSRPVPGKRWEYAFYAECEGSVDETSLKKAVTQLEDNAASVNVLGSYKSAKANGDSQASK